MTTTKVYKTMIGARMAIMVGKIKSFFKGGHYVVETYTLKFDKVNKTYNVEHYTMTHDEEKEFYEAIGEQQAKIMKMMLPTNESGVPTIDRQHMAVVNLSEKNNQTEAEAPKMNAKPKQKAKPKSNKIDPNIDTEKIVNDIKNRGVYNDEVKPKTKKKYYHNNNKKKADNKGNTTNQ